jgi:quinol-cytochrome oxidoreductase complex cytochrome b subunit
MNCWASKCHAANHPTDGFLLPRTVPPAVGPGSLKRFVTADQLQAYLYESMPWWKPGSLSLDESWQLTAFLLRQQGSLPAEADFSPKQAKTSPVHLPIRPLQGERLWSLVFMGVLGLAAISYIAQTVKERYNVITFERLNVPTSQHSNVPTFQRFNVPTSQRSSFFAHLHPSTIPALQARWRYTLGAGGLAVFLSLVILVTGILEMYFYVPTPELAGPSIQTITFLVPYGALVRGLHFWAAQALVVVAVIHLLRVVFTGAYARPRRFNYLLGLGLLVTVLFLDFTGYVLRWDEGIRWALMVGSSLLRIIPLVGETLYSFVIGGDTPGAAALNRFYAWHIFGLTIVMAVLVAWHIFRVRRDGGIASPPRKDQDDSHFGSDCHLDPPRISRRELVRREVLAMLIASAVLILVAALLPAPLAPPIGSVGIATPLQTEQVRAPWFFLWIQQLLRYGDAFWLGAALPLGLLALLVALPYLFGNIPPQQLGRWFPPAARLAALVAVAVVIFWLAMTLLEVILY